MRTTYVTRIALWCSALLHRLSSRFSLVRPPLARSASHLRALVVALLLAATLLAGFNTPFAYGMGASHAIAQTPAPQGKPHKIDAKSGTKSVLHQPPASKAPPAGPALTERPAMSHGFVPTMKPGSLKLDPNNATQFVGSDGRLEIDVPAGAITASDVAAVAGHTLGLRITEIAPPSGSNAGSEAISLGSYSVQVVDGQGNASDLFTHGLRKGVTLKLHYTAKERTLGLDSAFVVFNGAHPQTISGLGASSTQPVTNDATGDVLQTQLPADTTLVAPTAPPTSTPTPTPTQTPTATATPTSAATATAGATPAASPTAGAQNQTSSTGSALHVQTVAAVYTQQTPPTTFTFNTYPPIAKFGNPDPLDVDMNAGSLTEGIQLDVPPGPAGAMPNLTLAYNSAAVNEQHSPQGAAGWVGEGWSLSLGSISWAEHNVVPTCTTSCTNSWQSQWMLNDPFGTSTELIPPNLATSTYYDDSNNWWCTTGNASSDTCPIQFQTANEGYAKVYAYVGPTKIGTQTDPFPCFRVYLRNGVMEEFGCTADSLQYYPLLSGSLPHQGNSGVVYPVAWMLDLITNPQGGQVHITYQRDMATASNGVSYPRDIVPSTIEWDSPDCNDSRLLCPSASWHPHYRVQFAATHSTYVAHPANTPTGCNTDATVRCDDPMNITGTNGSNAPLVNGAFVLNDANVQINNTSSSSYSSTAWNTVRDYKFSYEQSGPTTIVDPVTGKNLSSAGYLDLTQFQEFGDDGTTSYPAMNFGYSSQTEYYEDGSYTPYSTTFCGPSWNTGGNGGTCDLWSHSYDGNSRYLTTIDNGQGLHQAISWRLARNNTHGAGTSHGADDVNPFYCTSHPTGYPCNSADDQAWSRIVVLGRSDTVNQLTQAGQNGTQTPTSITSNWTYNYYLSSLTAKECIDCVAGMYWGNQNDGDYMDYYNGKFMGFAEADVSNPDGSAEKHFYEATEGWGVYTLNTTLVPSCNSTLPPIQTACQLSPWWDVANAGHGLETEADYFDTDTGHTLLKKTTATYYADCPPSGVSATPVYTGSGSSFGPWGSNQVSELDHNNPVAVCDVQKTQQVTTTYDSNGFGSGNSISETDSYTYDIYGMVSQTKRVSSSGGSSPTTIYDKTTFIRNDGLTLPPSQRNATNQSPSTANPTWWNGAYIVELPALETVEDSSGNGNRYSCHYTLYDGMSVYTISQTSSLTKGNVTEQDTYTNCGTAPNYTVNASDKVGATTSYDTYSNATGTQDPDAVSGDTSHTIASGSCAGQTNCTQYDSNTAAKTTGSSSVGNLNDASGYNTGAAGGYGLWPTTTTDTNGQQTTYTYDGLGRMLTMVAPGQSSGPATQTTAYYNNLCPATGASSPCVEVDTTTRTSSTSSVLTRQFYDGENRLVETRTAAPGNNDIVQYVDYDPSGRVVNASVPYFVSAYTGGPGSAAFSTPDASQAGTQTTYDGLGRMTSVQNPLGQVTTTSYENACGWASYDSACYEATVVHDPLQHQSYTLTDAFGRVDYSTVDTGNGTSSNPWTWYTEYHYTYDANGNLVSLISLPAGSVTTVNFTYDATGRTTGMTDPDRGTEAYAYDANGNVIQTTDARGASGTIYAGYDGLNRQVWRNTSNSPTGAYATYSYDSTTGGNYGVGRLTGETFSGALGSGSYSYTYDRRGETTASTLTIGGTGGGSYPVGTSYNDAGQALMLTYPNGETATAAYNAQGWLGSLTWTQGSTTTKLLNAIAYTGSGGASGQMTSAQVGVDAVSGIVTYNFSASFDTLARPTDIKTSRVSDGATLFEEAPTYDAVGNITSETTTLPTGTDTQQFCYDDLNRLTWAGSVGTPPCTGTAITPGTLTSAQYSQTFGNSTLNRLTTSPLGDYTYGDPAHLHAATSVDYYGTTTYTASYDASGNMTCRAPTSSVSCAGSSPTGQHLSYDNEGRLTAWQNAPSSPTSTAQYLYDGEGNRVEQQATTGGTSTTTVYVGDIEQVATTSGTSTTTTYYYADGQRIALAVNGTLSYLASDLLGSATVALNGSGTPIASQLYAPYGGTRYSNGTMPTDYSFTGQRADSASGLDYYGARYYDPTLGQFTSADTVMDGLNRYAYVGGNPVNDVDPDGHMSDSTHFDLEGNFSGVNVDGLAGLANAVLQLIFGTTVAAASVASHNATTTTAISLAGAPDSGATFKVNGASIVVTSTGDLVVTQGSTTTDYAAGSAGWIKWSHDIDGAYTNTDVWNSRTAPKATTGTTTTTTTTGDGSVLQSGLPGGTGSGGSWGSGNPGVPTGTPPFTGGTLGGIAAAGSIILWAHSHENDLPSGGEMPYKPSKKGHNKPFWNSGYGGYEDENGDIWKWDKSGHGGGHWDVSDKNGGGHKNVYPSGKIRK